MKAVSIIGCLLLAFAAVGEEAHLPVLREDQVYERVFTVTNPYDRAVRINLIDVSCACSTLEVAQPFLLPGASTTLHMAAINTNLSGRMTRAVWLGVSDPDYEPIEIEASWIIRPMVFIDLLPPASTEVNSRPTETVWHDIYRYTSDARPEELHTLRKVMRIGSPEGEVPDGGLEIGPIVYQGDLWRFESRRLDAAHWLVIARAAEREAPPELGILREPVLIHTNHPGKPVLRLEYMTRISPEAGRNDPFAEFR